MAGSIGHGHLLNGEGARRVTASNDVDWVKLDITVRSAGRHHGYECRLPSKGTHLKCAPYERLKAIDGLVDEPDSRPVWIT